MIKAPEKIVHFIQEGIWDDHLPFLENSNTGKLEYCDVYNTKRMLSVGSFEISVWKHWQIELFDKYQWYFLSPVFEFDKAEMVHYSLDTRIKVPFIENERGEQTTIYGGFGEVRKVKIHHAHHIPENVRLNGHIPGSFN